MYGSRIVSGLAVVFASMAALFVVLAVAYSPVFLAVAAMFGAAAYFVWYHASGRFARRLYRGVEDRAQAEGAGSGGFGAGPREAWEPPRDGERAGDSRRQRARERVRQRTEAGSDPRTGRRRRTRARNAGAGGARNRRRAGGQRAGGPPPGSSDGPTMREAYSRLGLDPSADADAVTSAYREKVKEVHPDTPGGDEDEFKAVKAAYERLSDD